MLQIQDIQRDEFMCPASVKYYDENGIEKQQTFRLVFAELSEDEKERIKSTAESGMEISEELERRYGKNYDLKKLSEDDYVRWKANMDFFRKMGEIAIEKLTGWKQIKENGHDLEFTEENKEMLLKLPGMREAVQVAYRMARGDGNDPRKKT